MERPFTEEKIVFDPDEEEFFIMSKGIMGSPRPFRNIVAYYKDGSLFPASEPRIRECIMSDTGESFGAGVLTSGAVKSFDDLPPQQRQEAIGLARKYCVGVLDSTELDDMSKEEIDEAMLRALRDAQIENLETKKTLEEMQKEYKRNLPDGEDDIIDV